MIRIAVIISTSFTLIRVTCVLGSLNSSIYVESQKVDIN